MSNETPDEIVSGLLESADSDETESRTGLLLKALFSGYPVENLRRLTQSSHPPAIRAGVFLLSELGPAARPLLPELVTLLDHPDHYVRFHALDSLLLAAEPTDGPALARAVAAATSDSNEAVRWNGLRFLAHATDEQLRVAADSCSDPQMKAQIAWLASVRTAGHEETVASGLASSDRIERLFAAAAASRMSDRSRELLVTASAATDPDVQSFAESELRLLPPPKP